MANAPKPITIVAGSQAAGQPAPQPFAIVSDLTVDDITTANGSDAATTQALANATKATVNEILAALRTAGILTDES